MQKLDTPKAVFYGLALIAAAIYFGPVSVPATAKGGVTKIAICDVYGRNCAGVRPGVDNNRWAGSLDVVR